MRGKRGMAKVGVILVIFLLLIGGTQMVSSQEARAEGIEGETKRFGVGFQSSFPAWGISGMVDVADNLSVQGILGAFGDLKTYAGRGIYRFTRKPYYNAYGYGMIGAWSYTGYEYYWVGWSLRSRKTTETVLGFGAGVGIEYDWRAWSPNLPPIWWNLEVGLGMVNFEKVDYDFSTFMLGVGAHYRF